MLKTALFASAIISTASVATAAEPAASVNMAGGRTADTPAPRGKDVRYCVITDLTGSHIQRKVCHTRSDWIAMTGMDPLEKN